MISANIALAVITWVYIRSSITSASSALRTKMKDISLAVIIHFLGNAALYNYLQLELAPFPTSVGLFQARSDHKLILKQTSRSAIVSHVLHSGTEDLLLLHGLLRRLSYVSSHTLASSNVSGEEKNLKHRRHQNKPDGVQEDLKRR